MERPRIAALAEKTEEEEEEEEKENEEKGALESREKEKESDLEEEDLTQVTWEFLPDTQRTDADSLLPSVEREEAKGDERFSIPTLLLTPGRSSQPPTPSAATAASSSSACTTVRSARNGIVESARSLDLYFYPKLLTTGKTTEVIGACFNFYFTLYKTMRLLADFINK